MTDSRNDYFNFQHVGVTLSMRLMGFWHAPYSLAFLLVASYWERLLSLNPHESPTFKLVVQLSWKRCYHSLDIVEYCTNGHSQHPSIFVLRIAIAYEMNVSVLASHLNITLESRKGKNRLKYSLKYSIKIFH